MCNSESELRVQNSEFGNDFSAPHSYSAPRTPRALTVVDRRPLDHAVQPGPQHVEEVAHGAPSLHSITPRSPRGGIRTENGGPRPKAKINRMHMMHDVPDGMLGTRIEKRMFFLGRTGDPLLP